MQPISKMENKAELIVYNVLLLVTMVYSATDFQNPNISLVCSNNTVYVKWSPVHKIYDTVEEMKEAHQGLQYCNVSPLSCDSGYLRKDINLGCTAAGFKPVLQWNHSLARNEFHCSVTIQYVDYYDHSDDPPKIFSTREDCYFPISILDVNVRTFNNSTMDGLECNVTTAIGINSDVEIIWRNSNGTEIKRVSLGRSSARINNLAVYTSIYDGLLKNLNDEVYYCQAIIANTDPLVTATGTTKLKNLDPSSTVKSTVTTQTFDPTNNRSVVTTSKDPTSTYVLPSTPAIDPSSTVNITATMQSLDPTDIGSVVTASKNPSSTVNSVVLTMQDPTNNGSVVTTSKDSFQTAPLVISITVAMFLLVIITTLSILGMLLYKALHTLKHNGSGINMVIDKDYYSEIGGDVQSICEEPFCYSGYNKEDLIFKQWMSNSVDKKEEEMLAELVVGTTIDLSILEGSVDLDSETEDGSLQSASSFDGSLSTPLSGEYVGSDVAQSVGNYFIDSSSNIIATAIRAKVKLLPKILEREHPAAVLGDYVREDIIFDAIKPNLQQSCTTSDDNQVVISLPSTSDDYIKIDDLADHISKDAGSASRQIMSTSTGVTCINDEDTCCVEYDDVVFTDDILHT